jgi:hypothetical protein
MSMSEFIEVAGIRYYIDTEPGLVAAQEALYGAGIPAGRVSVESDGIVASTQGALFGAPCDSHEDGIREEITARYVQARRPASCGNEEGERRLMWDTRGEIPVRGWLTSWGRVIECAGSLVREWEEGPIHFDSLWDKFDIPAARVNEERGVMGAVDDGW